MKTATATATMFLILVSTLALPARAAQWTLKDEMTSCTFPMKAESFLTIPQASIAFAKDEVVWISDVEHLSLPDNPEYQYLANAPHKKVMGYGKITGGKRFELFPYHYADEGYEKILGAKAHYRLVLKNETTQPLALTIDGLGTALDWDHNKAWQAALAGERSEFIQLAAGESRVLFATDNVKAGLPFSAVSFGKLHGGELTVYDYCFTGTTDPGLDGCKPIEDFTWPPHNHPSFIRGMSDKFTANISYLPGQRDAQNNLPLSKLSDSPKSVAFGFSPGGPITDLCDYMRRNKLCA